MLREWKAHSPLWLCTNDRITINSHHRAGTWPLTFTKSLMKDLEQREERTKLECTITDSCYEDKSLPVSSGLFAQALSGPQLIQNLEAASLSLDIYYHCSPHPPNSPCGPQSTSGVLILWWLGKDILISEVSMLMALHLMWEHFPAIEYGQLHSLNCALLSPTHL